MKVLILNPPYVDNFCRSARWAARSRGRAQRHPDSLLIAAAVLEKSGHEVRFIDGAVLNLKRNEIEEEVGRFTPDLSVIHTTTPTIYNDISYAKLIKRRTSSRTVLVGPHVTAETQNTFSIAKDSVDVIARGEYDYSVKYLCEGKSTKDIPGISYIDNGIIVSNPKPELINVDELPFPSWKHIKPEWYFDSGKRVPFLTLISGRGCLGRCTFCRDTQLMYKRKLRLRAAKSVVDEIEYDYKLFPYIKEIMFETDTFTYSAEHAREICEEILKRNIKICFSCNVRSDMELSLLPLMKKAGCRMLMTGFEFGTQEALDSVKKGVTLGQSRKFAEKANKLGLTIHGCFMIGAPGETETSAQKTIDFAKSLHCDTIQISGICVYPGTELFNWAKKNNYIVPKDWNGWVSPDYEQVTLLSYPQLKKDQIDRFVDSGLREFYLRPRQIIKMLFNVNSLADLKRKLFGLKSFLEYFIKKQ